MTATIHPFPAARIWIAAQSETFPDSGWVVTADGVECATYGRSFDLEWSWHLDDGQGEISEGRVLAIADDEDAARAWLQGWLTTARGYSDAEAAEFVAGERGEPKAATRAMFQRAARAARPSVADLDQRDRFGR